MESGELDETSNSTSTSTSEGGLTNVQSGAIGAMVSLVAVFVVMFAFQLFGFLTVGKRQIRAQRQGDDNAVSWLDVGGTLLMGSFELRRLWTPCEQVGSIGEQKR